MKKVILLLTIPLVLVSKGFSQDDNRKGFTSFNLGSSMPVGNFSSKDFDNSQAGFATNGLVIDFTFGYRISKTLGITAIYRSQVNGHDMVAYAEGWEDYLDRHYPSVTSSVFVESTSFALSGIMVGINGSFSIGNNISFEPRIAIGPSVASLPAMTTEMYESGTKLVTTIRPQASTFTFSYIIGAGAKLDVSKKICLLANIDFYASNAYWEDVEEISIGHITGKTEKNYYHYSQKFTTINISAGLGFRF